MLDHSLVIMNIAICSLVVLGCPSDPQPSEDTDASTSGTTQATPPPDTNPSPDTTASSGSSSSSGGSTETGTPQDTTGDTTDDTTGDDATGDTTGEPPPLLDCTALCEPYADCDRSVYLTCYGNCGDVVPTLAAADEGCGAASATYFECRFSVSCEDAIAAQAGELDPPPCEPELMTYVDTCVAAAPPACGGYCDRLMECEGVPQDGCAFECLGLHGAAAQRNDPDCDAALDGYLTCYARNACMDLVAGTCDLAADELNQACNF